MERKKIFLIWLFGCIILMLTAAVVSILTWNFIYQPELNSIWRPITVFWNMVYLVPVGWLLSFLTPFGWASFVFMALSVYKKWPALLLGSAITTVISGAFWPITFVTMMGR
ncbi:MAG: hypothetical protein ABIJ50_01920 [Pseudomonadota bacterium]